MFGLLNEKLVEVYVKVGSGLQSLRARGEDEGGIETVEWVVLAAVIVVCLVAVMGVLQSQGDDVGKNIIKGLNVWIGKWAG